MTIWLSYLLRRPVWDAENKRLGVCLDVLVADVEKPLPSVRAIAVGKRKAEPQLYSAECVAWLSPSLILNTTTPITYVPRGDELWLKRQVLDRQIVDIEGRRLVRVNDLQLIRRNAHYCLASAAVSTAGLIRRLGAEGLAERLFRLLHREIPETLISWRDMAPVEAHAPIRLRVSRDKISQMHPADIAAIVNELDLPTGQALLTGLDTTMMADAMQEIDPELQVAILGNLPPMHAADVLEEMDPDDAADLLADLEPVDRDKLLDLMEDEDAVEVEKLLAYPADSAGGIMSSEYTTVPRGLTAGQALDYLRQSSAAREDETMYYVYVVDEQGGLQGVIALRDLVLALPSAPIEAIIDSNPVTVDLFTPQNEVAQRVAKYNLLAIPVVDDDQVLHGIVTVDDAIDAIIPTAWKKRLPRFF